MKTLTIAAATAALLTGAATVGARAVDEQAPDAGTDETLVFVVAGAYDSRAEAVRAAARTRFGDLQGFYPVPSSSLEAVPPGAWLLATAFRTERGASEFEELARAAGVPSLRRIVARYTGTDFVGLGQEPHPDGRGPLARPLPDDHPARIG